MPRPNVYKLDISGELKGTKVFFIGFQQQPRFLHESGRGFAGLKHLLELLKRKFKKFTLTFTPTEDSVSKDGTLYKVRLSANAVRVYGQRRWDANRQQNLRLGSQLLAERFPEHFTSGSSFYSYQKGMFSEILKPGFDARLLAPEDRATLTKFVTGDAVRTGKGAIDIPTAYETARDVQLLYLKNLVDDFETRIAEHHDESWWQAYFSKNILFFQTSYIRRLEKMNVTVPGTRFPDFAVVTSDAYLDIIEIKKPDTELLKEDNSRHNYYWSVEISKAISQLENYIDSVSRNGDAIRNDLRDKHGIDLQIIKPRGIIIAGRRGEQFRGNSKMAGDFRRLNEGLKNVEIIPYDELSQHVRNTIVAIQELAKSQKATAGGRRRKVQSLLQ